VEKTKRVAVGPRHAFDAGKPFALLGDEIETPGEEGVQLVLHLRSVVCDGATKTLQMVAQPHCFSLHDPPRIRDDRDLVARVAPGDRLQPVTGELVEARPRHRLRL
jgi:hypothetical protein